MTTLFGNLVLALSSQRNKQELRTFLLHILTPQDREIIPKRLEIIRLLKKGVPQRAIAKKLHVGIATVTRGAAELRLYSFGDD